MVKRKGLGWSKAQHQPVRGSSPSAIPSASSSLGDTNKGFGDTTMSSRSLLTDKLETGGLSRSGAMGGDDAKGVTSFRGGQQDHTVVSLLGSLL